MKMKDLLKVLFPAPKEHNAWMSLLETTEQTALIEADLPASDLIDLFNASLQNKQTGWLRAEGKERWEISGRFAPSKTKILSNALKDIGLYDCIVPTQKEYDAAFLMGATAWAVKERLDYLTNLMENGCTIKRLYVFSGYREMSPDVEAGYMQYIRDKVENLNEIDMMKYLVDEHVSKFKIFNGVKVVYLNASSAPGAKRATTTDNFLSWKESNMESNGDKKVMLVTNQPYVHYQSAVAFQVLSNNYTIPVKKSFDKETQGTIGDKLEIEAVGSQSGRRHYPDLGLDSAARFVYASRERWKKLATLQPAQQSRVLLSTSSSEHLHSNTSTVNSANKK